MSMSMRNLFLVGLIIAILLTTAPAYSAVPLQSELLPPRTIGAGTAVAINSTTVPFPVTVVEARDAATNTIVPDGVTFWSTGAMTGAHEFSCVVTNRACTFLFPVDPQGICWWRQGTDPRSCEVTVWSHIQIDPKPGATAKPNKKSAAQTAKKK